MENTLENIKPKCKTPISEIRQIQGILYFTVDLGIKGKQRWKTDGTTSVLVAYLK